MIRQPGGQRLNSQEVNQPSRLREFNDDKDFPAKAIAGRRFHILAGPGRSMSGLILFFDKDFVNELFDSVLKPPVLPPPLCSVCKLENQRLCINVKVTRVLRNYSNCQKSKHQIVCF